MQKLETRIKLNKVGNNAKLETRIKLNKVGNNTKLESRIKLNKVGNNAKIGIKNQTKQSCKIIQNWSLAKLGILQKHQT